MATSAAERGYAPANVFIGDMYKDGLGVEQDSSRALEWYQKGYDAGDRSAAGKIQIQSMTETIVPANSPMDAFYSSKGYSAAPAEQATSVVVYSNSAPRIW